MKHYKYIKIFLIAVPVIFFLFLLNKQYPINGKLTMAYDFSKPHPFIGKLMPDSRVNKIAKKGDEYSQTIKSDPAYFDLELPANYQKATIELKYKSKNQSIIEVGGMVSNNPWAFQKQPLQNVVTDQWQIGITTLDLTPLYKDSKHRVKIIISAPDLDKNNGEIEISEIKINLETKPLFEKIRNKFF